jgi:hypothetical protein
LKCTIYFKDLLFLQVINDRPNTCGPKAARLQDKAKEKLAKKTGSPTAARLQHGKWTKKTGSGDYETPEPEESADDAREDGSVEALTGAFATMHIQFYTDHICCWLKAKTTME